MAKSPRELESGAKVFIKGVHPDNLDGNATMSGTAQSRPTEPRLTDFDERMQGGVIFDEQPNPVSQTVSQQTRKVRPVTTGAKHSRA